MKSILYALQRPPLSVTEFFDGEYFRQFQAHSDCTRSPFWSLWCPAAFLRATSSRWRWSSEPGNWASPSGRSPSLLLTGCTGNRSSDRTKSSASLKGFYTSLPQRDTNNSQRTYFSCQAHTNT